MKKKCISCLILLISLLLSSCNSFTDSLSHTHTYETSWTYNNTYHWKVCEDSSCTTVFLKAEHSMTNETCSVCGYKSSNIGNLETISCAYEIVSAPMEKGLIVIDSVTDGQKNYYLLDLGYAKNVPIWSGPTVTYDENQLTEPELTFSKAEQTEQSVEQSVSKTISRTVSKTYSENQTTKIGVELSLGFLKLDASSNATLETSYSRSWGSTVENENSTTNAYSAMQTVAESYVQDITFTVGGQGHGNYRLSMLGTCDIYAVLETDLNNENTLSITYTTCPRDDVKLIIEYCSLNDDWIDDNAEKISLPTGYLEMLVRPEKLLSTGESSAKVIEVPISRQNSADGEKYDTSKKEMNEHLKKTHDHFELGQVMLYGCTVNEDQYSIYCLENFGIKYRVDVNPNNIPKTPNGRNVFINDDGCTHVFGTNIYSKVGKGTYWIRVTYNDNTEQFVDFQTNIFQTCSEGSYIQLLSPNQISGNISAIVKIELTIVYELYTVLEGYTNWRCDYVFNFNN